MYDFFYGMADYVTKQQANTDVRFQRRPPRNGGSAGGVSTEEPTVNPSRRQERHVI
jgi:hypothetical protein